MSLNHVTSTTTWIGSRYALGWVMFKEVTVEVYTVECELCKTICYDKLIKSVKYYVGADCERPIQPAPRSVPAPRSAPRSAPPFFSHARSPLRSAPPDFRVAPLRFPLRSHALVRNGVG